MITFHNFRFFEHNKPIDCTIPDSSIIFLENCTENIFINKPFAGEIHYENFPIQAGMKSFLKNIFYYFDGNLLEKNTTVAGNFKKFASLFKCEMIKNLPISYFNLHENILKEKVKNLDAQTLLALNYGLILFFRGKISLIKTCETTNSHNAQILTNIIASKAQYGKDSVFYFGKNLHIETQIVINL